MNPWENDPIVESTSSTAPWESDPIVEPTAVSEPDLFDSEDFQRLSEDRQKKAIEEKLIKEGKLEKAKPSLMDYLPRIPGVKKNEREFLIEEEYNKYRYGPETTSRKGEVFKQGLAAPMKGMQNVVASIVHSNSTNPELKDAAAKLIQSNRLEQAQLDELQSRTPDTEGAQTVPQIGVTLPYAGARIGAAAMSAIPKIGGWLKGLGTTADLATQGYVAGKTMPTSSALTPEENPEEAVKRQQRQSSNNAQTAAVIGGAIPATGSLVSKLASAAPTRTVYNWIRGVFGSTDEAESRVAQSYQEAASTARGEPVATQQLAGEIEQGTAKQQAVNEKFGTDFQLTTPQAAGDEFATNFQKSNEANISLGLASANKQGTKAPIKNVDVVAGKNQEELAKLTQQTRETLTPAQKEALPNVAREVGETPMQHIQDTYKPVDFDDLEKVVALKKTNTRAVETMETAKKNYDDLYNKAKVNKATPSDNTKFAISDNIDELAGLGKGNAKIIEEFGSKETHTAKELIEFNSRLSEISNKLRRDTSLPAQNLHEIVQNIRASIKQDLASSPIAEVAENAKAANDLFRKTQETLYERPNDLLGTSQPSVFAELRNKKGGRTSLEDETTTSTVRTSEDIADLRRGAKFVEGTSAGAERDVKNYLMADLKESLKNNPTPAIFDTWLAKNTLKVREVPGFDRELLGLKASIVKEGQNIATAKALLGGEDAASKAVKGAMESPEKMKALVALADKDKSGDARKGLQQLFQSHIEDALTTVQRKGTEQSGTKIAEANAYFDSLFENPETKEALKVLWGDKADSLEEVATLFKRLNIDTSSTLPPVGGQSAAAGALEGAISQVAPVRAMAINRLDKVLDTIYNRERNRVIARFVADPEYAATILKAYKEPTKVNIDAAVDALNNLAVPLAVTEGKSKPKINKNIPKGVKKEKEEKQSSIIKDTLKALNPISEAEAADKVPYNPEYSKMLGKLKSNENRKLANRTIEEAEKQGVNHKLALNVANAESNFKHDAKAKTTSASGIFQITKGTAKEIKEKILKDPKLDVKTPEGNTKAGIAYIKHVKEKLEKTVGKSVPDYMVYTGYHSGIEGAVTLLSPKNQKKSAASLMPAAAKANPKIYYNPNGKPYSVAKVRQNLKDYYESKRLDK